VELFDTQNDPQQFHNLADRPEHKATVAQFQQKLAAKLQQVRDNDLNLAK
jgi:iduronate 2-sulfatase